MFKGFNKSKSYWLALLVHIAILLFVGNILIMKPQVRQAFFQGKVLSTKDVNMQRSKFDPKVKLTQDAAASSAKEIIVPDRTPLAVDSGLEMPSISKMPDINTGDMQIDNKREMVSAGPSSRGKLDFSNKAKISGSGTGIQGTLYFPISMYSDWDNDVRSIPNLMSELGRRTKIKVSIDQRAINFEDKKVIFQYPLVYMNGHRAFTFTETEIENIREYLTRGGFLFICNDNAQGGDFEVSLYKEFKKIFPDSSFQRVPMEHPIYHCFYDFQGYALPDGLYKGIPMAGSMLYYGDRMIVYYSSAGDACDAWAEAEGPKWPGTKYLATASHSFMKLSQTAATPERHGGAGDEGIENAFKMGVNVLVYALSETR